MSDFTFHYDEATRTATIEITTSGERLRITNISRAQADRWEKDKAAEFVKRGFRMHTPSLDLTRQES